MQNQQQRIVIIGYIRNTDGLKSRQGIPPRLIKTPGIGMIPPLSVHVPAACLAQDAPPTLLAGWLPAWRKTRPLLCWLVAAGALVAASAGFVYAMIGTSTNAMRWQLSLHAVEQLMFLS